MQELQLQPVQECTRPVWWTQFIASGRREFVARTSECGLDARAVTRNSQDSTMDGSARLIATFDICEFAAALDQLPLGSFRAAEHVAVHPSLIL